MDHYMDYPVSLEEPSSGLIVGHMLPTSTHTHTKREAHTHLSNVESIKWRNQATPFNTITTSQSHVSVAHWVCGDF